MTMKKAEQQEINEKVFAEWIKGYYDFQTNAVYNDERLRTCSARVIETGSYIFLQSYNTIVAFYDKATDELYDVLRLVYGYTATSAQHIAKFNSDYCKTQYIYTWRHIR